MKRSFQGMLQIVRFNPVFYVVGSMTLVGGATALTVCWEFVPWILRWLAAASLGLAAWWLVASLVVSHLVYDRSDWPRGEWLRTLNDDHEIRRVLNVHCGFDETSARLRAWLPAAEIVALDLFDATRLTEHSIHRARALLPPEPGTLRGNPEQWPVQRGSYDMVCFLLSAHEYRQANEREALFQRARESIRPGGCVILAEHTRDIANFAAFGPGFLHFHSPASWHHAWRSAGFLLKRQVRVTPWLTVWCLQFDNP